MNAYGNCIPLKEQLQSILNLPQVWICVKNPNHLADSVMRDVCEGDYIKNHPLNVGMFNFLQLPLLYDDVVIQNPFRASQKYKLAMFYFSILRAKLRTIFLVGIAMSKDVKKSGLHDILRDFTATIKELNTNGITIKIGDENIVIKGDLIYAVCDTPEAAVLGGPRKVQHLLKNLAEDAMDQNQK